MVPGALHDYNIYVNTGPTRNYGAFSPSGPPDSNGPTLSSIAPADIYNGVYTGGDEDNIQYDCKYWNDKGQASTNSMGPGDLTFSWNLANNTSSVNFQGAAANPLELSPPLTWNLTVTINESNPSAPTAQVSGTHTCYPAHTIKVNGTVVYDSFAAYGIPESNNLVYLAKCLSGKFPPVPVGIPPVIVNLQ
jgi:hypothetical protein